MGANVACMQLIIKYNKGIWFLLCVIDLFSSHSLVIPLKDKKGSAITNAFQNNLDNSRRKVNKIWADQGNEQIKVD